MNSIPVGGFVILSGKNAWFSSGPKKEPAKKTRRRRTTTTNNKPVIYPEFEAASKVVDDRYWHSVLDNLSKGKLPRKIKYSGGYLTYTIRKKTKVLQIDKDDPQRTASETISFIQDNLGILSQMDKERRDKEIRKAYYLQMQNRNLNSWGACDNETSKQQMINRYIREVTEMYQLDTTSRGSLVKTIKLGLALGYFTADEISVNQGKIISISGLIRVGSMFSIDPSACSKPKKCGKNVVSKETINDNTYTTNSGIDPERPDNVSFEKEWTTFLRTMRKGNERKQVGLL